MELNGAVALVTGANRGIGLALARALRDRGATVYGGTRSVEVLTEPGIVPVQLDVTDHERIAALASQLTDVNLLINNAGSTAPGLTFGPEALANARHELEVNFFGPYAAAQAFAPVLAANGGGAIVNVLSVLSWTSVPRLTGYSASKAAAWSLTSSLRAALREQGTLVTGAHFGYVDTDMARNVDGPKLRPEDVAAAILDGVARGEEEVIVDDFSRAVKASLSAGLGRVPA